MSPGAGGGSATQIERRWARRFPFDAAIEIAWGSSTLLGRVRDISNSGMLLSSPEPLWIGASFSAKLILDPPIEVDCTIRRVEPGRGIGVQMSTQQQEHQTQLHDLLTRLESNR
jgi:hypothetical protein